MSRHAAPTPIAVEPLLLPDGFTQDPDGGRPLPYGPSAAEWRREADAAAAHARPPGEPGDLVDAAPGLFGATANQLPAGLWNPAPVVNVNGQLLATSAPGTGELAGLVVLDDLRVLWGTPGDTIAQADPAEASFVLLDFSRTWATRQDVIGLPVALGYAFPAGATPDGIDSGTFFRGRISDVALTFVRVRRPDGTHQQATRVAVKCTSVEVDLANRRPAEATWPTEPLTNRASRIAFYCDGVATVTARMNDWGPAQAAAADVGTTSIRDLLVQLYNSTGGDRMVFRPLPMLMTPGSAGGLGGRYENLGRRTDSTRAQGRLTYGGTTHPRYNKGAWVAAVQRGVMTYATPTDPGNALYLDAAVLEYDAGLSRSMTSRITRSSVTSKDHLLQDASRTTTRIAPAATESVVGQRAVTLDSLHNWNEWADLNAEDLLAMATQEGGLWNPGRLRLDTRKTGGFELLPQARALLLGHVTGYRWWIERSQLTQLGVRPMFSITGGVIAYRKGAWVLDLDVAGWATYGGGNSSPTYQRQHAATWEELAGDGTSQFGVLTWGTGDQPGPTNLHSSVTYEDLAHVGLGLAVTTGPDQGWDQ